MNDKVFCVMPWAEVFVDEYGAKPCCLFKNKNPIDLKDYSKNKEIQEIKRLSLSGIAPLQCESCVRSEKDTGYSLRKNTNEYYSNIKFSDDSPFENFHFLTSNTCNLKCLPCSHASFTRLQELKKLNLILDIKHFSENKFEPFIYDYKFNKITFLGGEPFLDKITFNIIDKLIDKIQTKNINIDLNTNGTVINDLMLQKLSENFKLVSIKFSLDGVGKINDYLRYPSQWAIIEKNIDLVKKYNNIDLIITTALSNLSLLKYYELVDWIILNKIKRVFLTIVQEPNVLAPSLLPDNIKLILIEKYKNLIQNPFVQEHIFVKNCIETCIRLCKNLNTCSDKEFDEFLNWIKKHDTNRNNNVFDVFNELKDYGKT